MKIQKTVLIMLVMTAAILTVIGLAGCKESACDKSEVGAGCAGTEFCAKCGQMAAGDKCCKVGQEKCDKCGLDKGSPGCCKLPKA